MLLRRIIEHVKAQNWFAVWLDLGIVILGVFIGLQVSNWNAQRSERQLEALYLQSLKKDVSESLVAAQSLRTNIQTQQTSRLTLLNLSVDPEFELDPKLRNTLIAESVWSGDSFTASQTSFQTLSSTGQLSILQRDLVEALQELAVELSTRVKLERDEEQVLMRFTDPFLIENLPLLEVFQGGREDTGLAWVKGIPPVLLSKGTPDALRSQTFANILLYRISMGDISIRSMTRLIDTYERIEILINSRLDQLKITQT